LGVLGVLLMLLLGVQPWTGISVNPTAAWNIAHSMKLSLWGTACGLLAGVIIAAIWRGKLVTSDAAASKEKILVERTGQPFSNAESLLAAFSLVGLFGGYRLACYAFIGTTAVLVVARLALSKKRWEISKLALPTLFLVVVVFITSWKPLTGRLPI